MLLGGLVSYGHKVHGCEHVQRSTLDSAGFSRRSAGTTRTGARLVEGNSTIQTSEAAKAAAAKRKRITATIFLLHHVARTIALQQRGG